MVRGTYWCGWIVVFAIAGVARADAMGDVLPADDLTKPLMLQQNIVNPAEAAREAQTQPAAPSGFTHSWELPPVTVVGEPVPALREDQLVGTYAQPRWTADRRFAETRVYVRPEGSLQFEYWLIPNVARHGPSEIVQQFELEFGLPYRFQLDLYLSPRKEGSGGPTFLDSSIELRYALADWGKIWGNPTLYAEYTSRDQGPDSLELKLLLGGAIAPRWHWGADVAFEHGFNYDFYNTYEVTGGVSYTLADERFDVGARSSSMRPPCMATGAISRTTR